MKLISNGTIRYKAGPIIFWLLISITFTYYLVVSRQGGGGDLFTRIAESKYFLLRINPYDAFRELHPALEAVGTPPAVYTFVSYLFLAPLAVLPIGDSSILIFIAVELAAIISMCLLLKRELRVSWASISAGLAFMLGSVFFRQHVLFLNYNLIVAMALLFSLWASSTRHMLLFLASGFLVGLKPTVLIPLLIMLLARRKFRQATFLVTLYTICLLGVCAYLGFGPVTYFAQLSSTAEQWSNFSNSGLLAVFNYFGLRPSTAVSVAVSSIIILALTRLSIDSFITNYAIIVFAALAFFYNNPHAWIMVFPIFVAWLDAYRRDISSLWIGASIALFLIVPKAESLYPQSIRETLLIAHNIIRFGVLGFALYSFIVAYKANANQSTPPAMPTSNN